MGGLRSPIDQRKQELQRPLEHKEEHVFVVCVSTFIMQPAFFCVKIFSRFALLHIDFVP